MVLCRKVSSQRLKHFLVATIALVLSSSTYAHPYSSSLIDTKAFDISEVSVLPKGARVVATHANEFVITGGQERQTVYPYRSHSHMIALNKRRHHLVSRHGDGRSYHWASNTHNSLVKVAMNRRGQRGMRG